MDFGKEVFNNSYLYNKVLVKRLCLKVVKRYIYKLKVYLLINKRCM